ncbi:MAG: hypothetical protein IJV07_02355 [Alphaproteobacteria bacterium]|nr:hypothetical protein [Alphaproteobacteria bacterium]
MSFMEKILVLSGTLWLSAVGFIVYAWIVQARQQQILRYIAERLAAIDKKLSPTTEKRISSSASSAEQLIKSTPETMITIDKNEPISKYETVNLPDEIDINFVDR